MALSIKNTRAEELARELAQLRGLPITTAVMEELQRGVDRERKKPLKSHTAEERFRKIMEISERAAKRPVLDPRHSDEILYDEFGLPK
jgi:antitoxin VapB